MNSDYSDEFNSSSIESQIAAALSTHVFSKNVTKRLRLYQVSGILKWLNK